MVALVVSKDVEFCLCPRLVLLVLQPRLGQVKFPKPMQHCRHVVAALVLFEVCNTAAAKLTPEQAESLPPPASESIIFSRDIKPIFEASCTQCHGRGRNKGGFQLDTRETLLKGGDSGPAVLKGKSQDSLLVELVAGVDPDNVMPKKGKRLTPQQGGLLPAWIDQGLTWDTDISFAKPPPRNLMRRVPDIQVSMTSRVNPIDQILRPYFQAHGFKPPAPVSDGLFSRRVYLDLLGVVPPVGGPGAFVSDGDPQMRRH